jgi:hypothetical protein
MVTRTTLGGGEISRIFKRDSLDLSKGIWTSMITTSGFSCWASLRASRSLGTWAMISRPP